MLYYGLVSQTNTDCPCPVSWLKDTGQKERALALTSISDFFKNCFCTSDKMHGTVWQTFVFSTTNKARVVKRSNTGHSRCSPSGSWVRVPSRAIFFFFFLFSFPPFFLPLPFWGLNYCILVCLLMLIIIRKSKIILEFYFCTILDFFVLLKFPELSFP
jgi:hypothetical protein